ncbi:ribosomal protein L7/L12 C-terminal domain-containing protein [Amylocarpus encephaloides]|uniref:Ribosomal protein L7/L12 C-terminal domain-containing protein n=1 Tax=Amylocarpus encephaloides TaxID=45428 RepID=A0A9P7YEK4_9HELO|nr:ribosomal protein L7/L12 C-terminal domain-containing protein [Amylocarpus encephaloides]
MSLSCYTVAQCCVRTLRSSSTIRTPTVCLAQRRNAAPTRRWASTDAAANPKISGIVDQISQLTLLETADLVSSLKARLNIPDMPMGGFAASGPVAPAAGPVEEEEAAPAQQEKTLFNLKLESFDSGAKPKIIKEIKSMLGLSLVDSKKFVESAPKQMKEGVPKDEAEKIIATLKALGGVVTMD